MTTAASALQTAIQHHRDHDWAKAEKIYRQILAVQPEAVDVLYRLGILKGQQGENAEAEQLFESILSIEKTSFEAWFGLGNLYQGQAQWAKAVNAYKQAVAIRSEEAAVFNNLGYVLQQQGNQEDAIACYQKALDLDPHCTEARVNLASSLLTADSICSFDVFDTLIARFCIAPEAIFHQVEQKVGVDGFADHRQAAEQVLLQQADNYTLKDIYQQLAKTLSLGQHELERLEMAEIEAELQNVIGIQENLEKVRDGDLLISDMYLPEAVLRKMLQKAGCDKQVDLVVTAQGKHSGTAWQTIIEQWQVAQHLGDNPHSDIKMAQKHGIRAYLYSSAAPSAVETVLSDIGAGTLARVIRKIRLEHHFTTPLRSNFYNCFLQGNLVMLTIFSVFLLQMSEDTNIKRFLLSSRDCYHLHTLFRQIINRSGADIDCKYFLTSRLSRIGSSEDYLSYLLRLMSTQGQTAIVDLAGTGLSLSYLLQQVRPDLRLPPVPLVFFHQTRLERVENMYSGQRLDHEIYTFIPEDALNLDLDALEILNYIKQPMLRDIHKQGQHEYSPVFCHNEAPEEILSLIDRTEQIVDEFATQITSEMIDEIRYGVAGEDLKQLALVIYQQLSQNDDLLSFFMTFHAGENAQVERELSSLLREVGQ